MSHETNTLTRIGLVRQYPFDLAAVTVGAILAYGIVTSFQGDSVGRLLATFPLVLFLPGYALVAVLFPATERNGQEATTTPIERRPRGIDVVERLGLSFALSLAVVSLVGLALPITQWGFTTASTAAALGIVTVVLAQLGAIRRLRMPASDRFTVSPVASLGRLRGDGSVATTASTAVLVLAIGAAVGALMLGVLAPASPGGFTELALYGETEDGDLVTGTIDDEIEAGQSIPVTVSIENQEGEETDYTVVVQEQTLEDGDVVDRTTLESIETTIPDDTTGTGELSVTPTADPGETVRISVLLFDEEPPDEPTNDDAMQDTYFWVTVEE